VHRRSRRRRDHANVIVVEGMVVVMLLSIAMAMVMTHQPSPSQYHHHADRAAVEAQVLGILTHLANAPSNDHYTTLLERTIALGILGNTTAFDRIIERAMPPMTECRLFLDNGKERRLIAGSAERTARESVSRTVLFRPQWAYTFALPALGVVAPDMPLDVMAIGVSQGSLVKEHGAPILVEAQSNKGNYTATTILTIRDGANAELWLRDQLGNPARHPPRPPPPQVTHTANGTSSLPNGTFGVPNLTTEFTAKLTLTGAIVQYTLNLTDPLGAKHTLTANGAGTVNATKRIANPVPGTWTYNGTGRIVPDDQNPASARLTINQTTPLQERNWTFLLKETNNKTLAPRTVVTLEFPAVFTGLDHTPLIQAGWENITITNTTSHGQRLTAQTTAPLTNGTLELNVQATKPLLSEPLYQVHGQVKGGADGAYTFLLTKGVDVSLPQNPLSKGFTISGPKTVAKDTWTTWTLLFANPTLLNLGEAEEIHTITLTALDANVFQEVLGANWTLLDAQTLQWKSNQPRFLEPNQALEVPVNFRVTTRPTGSEPRITIPVSDGNGTWELRGMSTPWVYTGSIPPQEILPGTTGHGYEKPTLTGVPPKGNGSLDAAWYSRRMLLEGSMNYTVSSFPPLGAIQEHLRTGLARSQVRIPDPTVRVGDEVNISVDFRGLLDQLNVSGYSITGWNVEVKVYDPTQPFSFLEEMVPSFHGEFGAAPDIVVTNPERGTVVAWTMERAGIFTSASANITLKAPHNALYGPYPVIGHARFLIVEPGGISTWASATRMGLIDVHPNSGQGGSLMYHALLECWLPHW
jgi:hypothetical protein